MDIVERLRKHEIHWAIFKEAADEIERLREQERKMTSHALDRMEEIERLRDAICDMKRNIRTVDRAFMKESTQEILDAIEKSDEDNSHK